MAGIQLPYTMLVVKKLPDDLRYDEVVDLLKYFGASAVSVMSPRGSMKGTAFAEFNTHTEAEVAMRKLHQASLFGSRLVVEFSDKNFMPVDRTETLLNFTKQKPQEVPKEGERPKVEEASGDPSLHYLYPPPTPHTLSNITHALVTIPQFYIQVLHLMNKMNLPPPFTQSSQKSIFDSAEPKQPALPSDTESELETDEDEEKCETSAIEKGILEEKRVATKAFIDSRLSVSDRKRKREVSGISSSSIKSSRLEEKSVPSPSLTEPDSVEMELSDAAECDSNPGGAEKVDDGNTESVRLVPPPPPPHPPPAPAVSPPLVPTVLATSPSALQIPDQPTMPDNPMESAVEQIASRASVLSQPNVVDPSMIPQPVTVQPKCSGTKQSTSSSSIPELSIFDKYRCSVRTKCLSPDKLSEMPVFKNYRKGEPSCKLYIKNLNHKSVTKEEITALFQPYFDNFEHEGTNFEIKVMTEGRMKGQAFILLPNVESAAMAMNDFHGYELHNKPMAICFAKSK